MTREEFILEVEKLGLKLTKVQIEQLEIYKDFLKGYNKHTNLTAIKEDSEIYLKHFYDSLTILKSFDLNKIKNLLDVGTGAGFPGMVLKICFPHLEVVLLDSNNKKIKFLTSLAQKLNLEVELVNDRVENFAKNNLNKFDVVTSRAVANLRVLSELCLPLVNTNGFFIAFKGSIEEELKAAIDTLDVFTSEIILIKEFTLFKNSDTRHILIIQKNNNTNKDMLRPYDKIIKKPLKKNMK